jgi:predicted RNA methylase
VVSCFGPEAGRVFDQLESAGFLTDPEKSSSTPHFFHGFTNVNLHRAMLADRVRLDCYRRALTSAIDDETVVIDAGCGTGILSIYAAQAGARKVYAIDNSSYVDIARRIVADNQMGDRIEVIKGDFAQVILPEKADVIVTETFGVMFFTEGAAPELSRLAASYLKPGGRILPHDFSLHLATLKAVSKELIDVFEKRDDGVVLSCLREEAEAKAIIDRVEVGHVIKSYPLGRYPITTDVSARELEVTATLHGPCKGICGWFDLHFSNGDTLSTSPTSNATSWHQAVFPVALPSGKHALDLYFGLNPMSRRYMYVRFGDPINRTITI